ncbi:MAG: carbohydrate-binding family V/XII [Planctomycetota bacterium]|jgi:hypothetical protein
MKTGKEKTSMSPSLLWIGLVLGLLAFPALAQEPDEEVGMEWPHEIAVPEGVIVIYQPQPESFEGDKLTARAAVSVTRTSESEPVFGAAWFEARVATDRDERTVTLIDLDVTAAKFPEADGEKLKKFKEIVQSNITASAHPISLDRLLTSLDLVDKEEAAAEDLRSDPPKIMFVSQPAVLILIDGEPELQQMQNSKVMRVVNSPFFIVLDPGTKTYYLKGEGTWFSAEKVKGTWQAVAVVPNDVKVAAMLDKSAPLNDQKPSEGGGPPKIIVATEPTELIQSDGEPKFSHIEDTDLLYLSNSDSDLFMEIDTQFYFVLLSGRWFKSDSLLKDTWTHVPSDELPDDFARIPADSPKGHVLANVAGTVEARDAVLETYIPQTAAVSREDAELEVTYDGDPEFEEIEGTEMEYAVNTNYQVIRWQSRYYCCYDAVWYESDSALGPWIVCIDVPDVIYTCPPSCPIYNVTYVRVYRYTPTVVYVGYTPGYVGCYSYGGVVVYGTGYYYRPWWRRYYYPRHCTYGFAVRYNPHTGNWGFVAGRRTYHHAWIRHGAGGHNGWWGTGGYRHVDVDINRNINIDGRRNIYNRRNDVVRTPGVRTPVADRGVVRTTGTGPKRDPGKAASRAAVSRPPQKTQQRVTTQRDKRNNVYADRSGNVHRRTDNGWQQRSRSGWTEANRTKSKASTQQASRSRLDREHQVRQRGTSRTQNYQKKYRSSSSRSSRPVRHAPARRR